MSKRKGRRTMGNHLRHIAACLERDGYSRFPPVLRQAAKELFDLRAEVTDLKIAATKAARRMKP